MTTGRLHTLLGVVAAAFAAVACKRYDDVKLLRDAPTQVAAGERYEYVFHVTRPIKKAYFASCGGNFETPTLDRDTGKVTFTSSYEREVKVCAEYKVTDGPTVDRYELSVKVGPRAAVGPDAFPKPVAAFYAKLKGALGALDTGSAAAPKKCPKLAGVVHAYQVDWLKHLVATPTRPFTGGFLIFAPPYQLVQSLTEPEASPTA